MLKGIRNNWSTMNTEAINNVKWKKTEKRFELSFVGLVALVAVVVGIVSSGTFESTSVAVVPVSAPSFIGSVTHVSLINQSSVSVNYSIKNRGHSPATPNCTIMVQDPSGSFPSFYASISSRSISAGHSLSSKMIVSIAGPGPQYVTQGKIHCT